MTKNTYILAVMLCSILSYGQQITFHKNVNSRASALLQSLNKEGDSLILESENKQIIKVDIFNKSFSKRIDINSNKTKIDLKTLPLGNFIVQARIDQKWITMYLEKNNDAEIAASDQKEQDLSLNTKHKSYKNGSLDEKDQDINITTKRKFNNKETSERKDQYTSNNSLIIKQKSNSTSKPKNSGYYWVISESNTGFGSSKSMRLEYKDDIAKLISKHKLELKSNVGKNNKLIIYEVYNTSKFMPNQLRNPIYYKTETSTFFNVVPIYITMGKDVSDF